MCVHYWGIWKMKVINNNNKIQLWGFIKMGTASCKNPIFICPCMKFTFDRFLFKPQFGWIPSPILLIARFDVKPNKNVLDFMAIVNTIGVLSSQSIHIFICYFPSVSRSRSYSSSCIQVYFKTVFNLFVFFPAL